MATRSSLQRPVSVLCSLVTRLRLAEHRRTSQHSTGHYAALWSRPGQGGSGARSQTTTFAVGVAFRRSVRLSALPMASSRPAFRAKQGRKHQSRSQEAGGPSASRILLRLLGCAAYPMPCLLPTSMQPPLREAGGVALGSRTEGSGCTAPRAPRLRWTQSSQPRRRLTVRPARSLAEKGGRGI